VTVDVREIPCQLAEGRPPPAVDGGHAMTTLLVEGTSVHFDA
jgi:hypothetical protein